MPAYPPSLVCVCGCVYFNKIIASRLRDLVIVFLVQLVGGFWRRRSRPSPGRPVEGPCGGSGGTGRPTEGRRRVPRSGEEGRTHTEGHSHSQTTGDR